MRVYIDTPLQEFSNDIGDVVRLFYGEGAVTASEADADMRLLHVHADTGIHWTESFQLVGKDVDVKQLTRIDSAEIKDGVEGKRRLKRLIKTTAYSVLKEFTDCRPAWGSLTGIRPTRLFYQHLHQGFTEDETARWMAEEFDISERKVNLLREIIKTQTGFLEDDPKLFDLYIGIPFCTTRCSFCSFSSGEIGDGRLVEPYLQALFKELEGTKDLACRLGLKLNAVYIGGGTPSSLSCAQLERLLCEVEKRFSEYREFTVEAGRPDTLDDEKLRMMKDHPVSRISINPQSMNEKTLRRIGRLHTPSDILRAFDAARDCGFDDINMDIIAALPGEDMGMFQKTLGWIRKLKPESLTVHTLAIKRSSKLHEQRYQQNDQLASQMVEEARHTAFELNLHPYYLYRQKYMADNLENVGYCSEGKVCRYNVDNMEETTHVIATGAGGISKFVPGKEKRILRSPNVSNIHQYIERIDEMIHRKDELFAAGEGILSCQ